MPVRHVPAYLLLLLYAQADGVVNFNHIDRQLFDTSIGVRLPILYGLKAGAEVRYEFNGGAAEGVAELDETHKAKFGYVW